MVAQFTVVQRPTSPEFNSAIFGEVQTGVSTDLKVIGTDADILTDHFTCSSAMNTQGGIYVNSSLSETSTLNTTCEVGGNFVTKGNLECPANGIVHGDVIVAGNVKWNSTCKVFGKMWVGGNFDCPTSGATVLGDLYVVGDVSIASACNLKGNIWIGGKLSMSNPQSWVGNVYVAGGVNANSSVTITTTGSVRIKGSLTGGFTAAKVTAPSKTIPDASLTKPPAPDMTVYFPPGDPKLDFPKITKTDARWSGWFMRKWRNDLDALKTGPYLADSCDQAWVSGSSNFTGPLVITTPTIYDLQQPTGSGGCGTSSVGLGGGLTIKLYADAVIFSSGATMKTTFRVESGDGNKHSLYIIEPWPAGKASCTSGPSGAGFTFNTPNFSQGPNAQVMVYTPGQINNTAYASPPLTLTGQLYGCNVLLSTPFKLNYSAATSGGGAAGRAFVVSERFRMDNQALRLP
jgi:cytoskeletal protein CcmA (bactofilin family)